MGARRLHPPERVAEYTAAGWWGEDTLDALFRARVRENPGRLAVVDPANKQDLVGLPPRRLTWGELDAEVDRLAAHLAQHGLVPGQVIGVQLPNTVEQVALYLACWRIGLIVSPMPMQYREHEISQLAKLAEFAAYVTVERFGGRSMAAEAATLGLPLISLDDVPAGSGGQLPVHVADPNDCVTICWTSGTESTPKGVPRCHNDWLAVATVCMEAPRMTADDVLLNPFPMVNMAGFAGLFLPWLLVGGVFVQHHPFDLPTFLAQIQGERVTYTVAAPALLNMLLAREDMLGTTDISSLTRIGSGSAPLSPAMVRGWQERHGIGVINFFGSNEGAGMLTDPYDVPDPEQRARYFPRYGTPGVSWSTRADKWTRMRVVDLVTGEDITEPERPGELRLKGPQVFAGYLGGAGLASPFDEQGYLKTGDIFEIAGERRQFIRYVDRAKDLVIRGGMNIAAAELEHLIAEHPAVGEVAIVGYPDEMLGEKICAVVIPAPGAEAPCLDDLVTFLRDRHIASYKLPERLELRDALPRNPVGKILKRELRASI